jgi:hypothetical protein
VEFWLTKDPSNYSNIRQIPDNQEVYLDSNGFTNIIFEIVERVDETVAATDQDAIKYHYQDMVSGTNDETRIWSEQAVTFSHLP